MVPCEKKLEKKFSLLSDPDGCLLLASTHSSAHSGGQCCVHGDPNCHEGAQLFPQPQAAGAHPNGAHHSQFVQYKTHY